MLILKKIDGKKACKITGMRRVNCLDRLSPHDHSLLSFIHVCIQADGYHHFMKSFQHFFEGFYSVTLTLKSHCKWGNFSCFCCSLLTIFRNTIRVLNNLDPELDRQSVSTDLGPNCCQMLSADDKKSLLSKEKVKCFKHLIFLMHNEGPRVRASPASLCCVLEQEH